MEKKFKPFFKWSGGKSKEFDKVVKWAPKEYNAYYEPFLGGGAIWLGLAPKKSIVGDYYDEVTNFFQILKSEGQTFIDECNKLSKTYNKLIKDNVTGTKSKSQGKAEFELAAEFYYDWRSKHNLVGKEKAKRFFVLRCLGYGGMLRFNSKGEFNVPYGYYKSLKTLDYPSGINKLLNNTAIITGDWEKTLQTAGEDDFVFFDPPYTREFIEYSSGNAFGSKEQERLFKYFELKKSKCMIIMNKDKFTHSLYKDYIKEEYDFNYSTKYRDRISDEDNRDIHFVATNY